MYSQFFPFLDRFSIELTRRKIEYADIASGNDAKKSKNLVINLILCFHSIKFSNFIPQIYILHTVSFISFIRIIILFCKVSVYSY